MEEVEFTYYRPDACEVFLLGDFNGWDPRSLPMKCTGAGTWIRRVALNSGAYLYRYLVRLVGQEAEWFFDSDESMFRIQWSPIGSNSVAVVSANMNEQVTASGALGRNNGRQQHLAASRRPTGDTIRINEQEHEMLRCFRILPDDHARSDIIHLIRGYGRPGRSYNQAMRNRS